MTSLPGGTVHALPDDFKKALVSDPAVTSLWKSLTPLARNEWICWVTSAVKSETRAKRIAVGLDKMQNGERRPCCWGGCIHRTDKPLSPSQKALSSKKKPHTT